MQIIKLNKSHSVHVGSIHIVGIPTGFISSLGKEFLSVLYEAIAEDRNSFGLVAIEDDKVLGFVAFSTNLSQLYKYVILKKGFKFTVILVRKMMSIKNIKKVWANLFYPKKMQQMALPDAELLSIAVVPEGRGKGIAKQLTNAGLEECRKRDIDKVKVLVADKNQPANKLYQKCGFEFITEISSHGVLSNIYVANLKKSDNV
ncbi:MAG: N-acetyltransferase [Phycisphaerae bacterium]